jgi:ATP-dependent helicase/nuclease subunit A
LVGDPKQAIYRFRNADIETFIDVKSGFRKGKSDESGFGAIRDLSTNFRSVKPVIQFVNSIFDDSKAGSAHPLYMGVEYKPLDFVHAPDDSAAGPAIRVMEYEAPLVNGKPEKASVELECDWTAKEIRRAITEKYKVTERVGKSGRGYRAEPATFGDVCVLIPVRTKLAELISALSVNGVPFASADPAIVFTRPLVLGLVNSLRVVAQLDDDMAIWAALKSPLFGLTDEQLVKYKQGPGSSWNIDGYAKGNEENVRLAMEVFYDVRTKVGIQSPVRVMQELLEAQRIFEKLSGYENGAFEASALRMVLSHAIQWENDGNTGLLQYAETLEVLSDAKSRTLLPMPDDIGANAVQIMTIHASKGLEFPITVVTCMAGLAQPRSSKILISKAGDIEFYIGKLNDKILIQSAGYSDLKDSEEKPASAQEANRLLYVAMTRAQDHLILSAIRIQSNSRSASLVSALDLLKNSEGFDAAIYESADHTNSTNGELPKGPASKLELIDLKRDFSKEIESSKKRRVVSPSSDFAVEMKVLSSAKQEDVTIVNQIEGNETSLYESDNSSSVVLASRDGRPFGRALHGVMDLVMKHGESPDDETLQRFIWQMASQENCMDDLANLNRKVAMLLASEIVIEALAAEQRWPELHLAIGDPNDEIRLAEGFADLVYKTATGYVLVDYKTDKEITFQSMSHYSQQLGAYGIILEKLTGAAPERILLLHITNDSVETIDL